MMQDSNKSQKMMNEGVLPPHIGCNSNPIYVNYSVDLYLAQVCYFYDSFGFNGQYIIANTFFLLNISSY